MVYLEVLRQTTCVWLTIGGRYRIGTCTATRLPRIVRRLIVFRSWSIRRRLEWIFAFGMVVMIEHLPELAVDCNHCSARGVFMFLQPFVAYQPRFDGLVDTLVLLASL
jgi:hypothetical protein